MKKLFVCRSYYHIYIALKYNDELSNMTILCVDTELDIDKIYNIKERIEKNFKNINLITSSNSYKDIRGKLEKYYDEIYLCHWVAYKMPEMYIYKKFKKSNFFMIEDGVNHYGGIEKSIVNKKIYVKYIVNYFLIGKKDLTLKNNVKEIYVTYLDRYPSYMSMKLRHIESKFNCNMVMNTKILDIFNIRIDNKYHYNNKNILIFTQPLSEDGYIKEDVKVRIYTNVVEILKKKGYTIFFKCHPREKTLYLFENDVIMLDRNFPAEVLNFTGMKFHAAIAICSGSIDTINAENKVKLYPEFFETIDYSNMELVTKNRVENIL